MANDIGWMKIEIERKFLVKNDQWRRQVIRVYPCRQGYLLHNPEKIVRVRVINDRGYLTIKSLQDQYSRLEFEYEIPPGDAEFLLKHFCAEALIEKTRHIVPWRNLTWEVDEFQGLNAGLVLAEVELERESQEIDLPPWVGMEVSADPKYYNVNLSRKPYSEWEAE
jgi:CYTH domain-containing protein